MRNGASLALAALIMLASGYGVVTAWDWPTKAALFPLAIGVPLFLLAALEAAWSLLGSKEPVTETKDFRLSAEGHGTRRAGIAVAWLLGFFAAIVLLGFPIALPLFVLAYLRLQAREGWTVSIAMTLALWGIFYGLFDRLLHLPFAAGWLLSWFAS